MAKRDKKSSHKIGLPPGSLKYIGKERNEPIEISLFNYHQDHLDEKNSVSVEEAIAFCDLNLTTWINVNGIHNVDAIEKICTHFNIHPLTIEDIIHTDQRPKLEENEDYLFLVLKMLEYDEKHKRLQTEQVSMILGKNYVISFQERSGDTFEPVRNRLRIGKGRIRKAGADYLLYALLDTIIDNYFYILEKIGDALEEIEEELLVSPGTRSLTSLYNLKRETVVLRRSIWPLREVVNKLEREEIKQIKKETRYFLRDVYDHTIRVIETIENFRDMLSSMLDLYQSTISNRMNMIMKVLTIISTIFIPLTFIVGVYGMNFVHMPELEWQYGYLGVWFIMIIVFITMLLFFRRKKWI
jgi:magnesium transporter